MDNDAIRGEESLIQTYLAPLAAGFPGAFGLEDDCAVIAPEPGCELVVKTDPVVSGIHFLSDAEPGDIAWRALAVNVSDLAAKGATPVAYLMALALPGAPRRAWMERFSAGLRQAQAAFGCHLAGGDTDRTPGLLTVSITAFGSVPVGRMVRRNGARPGDQLFVTGALGDAALGLALLRKPALAQSLGLDAGDVSHIIARFQRPQPRLSIGPMLRAHASAAMDLSDGLAKDCGRMCSASGVAARMKLSELPLSAAMQAAVRSDPAQHMHAVSGGDDYEILAAVRPNRVAAFLGDAAELAFPVTRIGEVCAGADVRIEHPDGTALAIGSAGWDHFDPSRTN